MNVRPRKAASKYTFEPKIPQSSEQTVVEVPAEEPAVGNGFLFKTQGRYAPESVDPDVSNHTFTFQDHSGAILSFPDGVVASKIVVYEDGSCALKIEDRIYPTTARFIGESLVVEHKEAAYNVGRAEFHLTSQGNAEEEA